MIYFTDKELRCPCCGKVDMDPDFMESIIALRISCDFPFPVSSAYRCPTHNNKVSTTGLKGPHTTGRAIDIRIYGSRAYELIARAPDFGITRIGINQKGPYNERFIHLDDLEPTWIWTY